MIAVNYTTVRENFKEYCDRANTDVETIFVTRKSGGNVVILSEAEYNNMIENLYIRSNNTNYDRLTKSIERLNQGKGIEKELIDA